MYNFIIRLYNLDKKRKIIFDLPIKKFSKKEVKIDNIDESDKNIQLKSHKEIHLEIYKTAKQKAKDIRKSAIQAYMEAKQLKAKYNLYDIESESDSDDNLEFIN